uniref:SUEL-type lectin domain-containing protein n=1 Tax=Pundamilia nyererei TaxID=303518 RepID=A0A3B4FF89_9CICH
MLRLVGFLAPQKTHKFAQSCLTDFFCLCVRWVVGTEACVTCTEVCLRCRGVITVQSAVYRCADTQACSQTGTQDIKNRYCDGRKVCDINMNIISASDPGVCTYLDTTYTCVPAIHNVTCEGSQANLQCGEGQVIVVSWVNYGRRDNTTCPDGNSDHVKNVLCSSPNSTEYVTNRCNWQNNCTVEASNTGFGDPCSGTYKYLEVFYTCQGKNLKPLDCIHSCAHKKVIIIISMLKKTQ